MLVQFSVGNFRSFKDVVTLDLTATGLKSNSKNKDVDENNTFEAPGGLRLLKSVVLYGANASGKSNLLKALEFMKTFVNDSAKESQAGDPINAEPFLLDSKTEKEPSFFEIVFILDEVRYRYGFEVTKKEVVSEWLYHTPNKKESYLFTRDEQAFDVNKKTFVEGYELRKYTRKNALFLSIAGQFNGKFATKIIEMFSKIRVFVGQNEFVDRLTHKLNLQDNPQKLLNKKKIISLIRKLDLGIEDVIFKPKHSNTNEESQTIEQKIGESISSILLGQTLTLHKKFNFSSHKENGKTFFDLEKHESDGTQRLFVLAGILINSLISGDPVIIDEIDARLHPLLTASLIELFHSLEDNHWNAQLIFATHDVNLLRNDRFRRDQIWFTEKDKYGASHLYSLAEFKVRNDASYQKDYLAGRYGAIPFIGAQNFLEGFQDGKAQKAR